MKTALIVMGFTAAVWAAEPIRTPSPDSKDSKAKSTDEQSERDEQAERDDQPERGWGMGSISLATRQVARLGDWEDQVPNIEKSIDRLWEENEWNEEADQFALQAVRGVAEIPPWQITRRVDFLTNEFGARYDMSEAQIKDLQAKTYQMIGAVAVRHGGTMFKHVTEMVDSVKSGEPVTPEDISRWMDEGEEMIEFAHEQVETISDQIAKELNAEQREVFERDRASYRKRMDRFEDMRERWKAGGWHPREWGLEEVPEYKQMMEQRVRDGRYDEQKWRRFDELQKAYRVYEAKSQETPYNESAWEFYVRQYIHQYGFDEAQAETAWSILREQRQLAGDVRRSAQRRMQRERVLMGRMGAMAMPLPESALEDIHGLFDGLCRRLDRIPTSSQKLAVERVLVPPLQALPASAKATGDQAPDQRTPGDQVADDR